MTPSEHKRQRQRDKFARKATLSAHPTPRDSVVKMESMLRAFGDKRGTGTNIEPRRQRASAVRRIT